MDQRPSPPPPLIPPAVLVWLRKPQFLIPIAVVVGMMIIAFGVQPSGAQGETAAKANITPTTLAAQPSTTPASTATQQPQATSTQQSQATAQQTNTTRTAGPPSAANNAATTPTSDVAGVRGTPAATSTADASSTADAQADLSRQSTQCGAIQETAVALAVEQSINGVSVKATKASTYPIEYFRCILMATGGQEAYSLSGAIAKAQTAGMTQAVLVDLWITNAGRDFGQVNLKESQLAAAGQVFAPLATLGGRAEVVVSSGQGRNVTLVVAIKNSVGATTGPVTLTINAPLFGGQPTQGKYYLFLPTP